ncbi:hypothetical protein FHS18_002386 [Paenibacillus phyllosphaerae]|uniref:Uncharacterized protein n=1 Tax=Paenibacillus phyllosphaerae TaxID=274593 RepID=A0A7W5AXJ9_9BACL|nr:hypothetical protein [Paenibacillus phyllosphaerae]MBB3110319.1 hypothetical protein [Paenibacillus phyllosphaerae]
MKVRIGLGIVAHFILGLMLPYVVVGSVVLLYGFMAPPTDAERTKGLIIGIIYLAFFIGVNFLTLRGLPGRQRLQLFLVQFAVFMVAAVSMFASLRWS